VMPVDLSQEEVSRYSRHLMIPDVGLEGQRKLKAASVLVVGTGGLGSPVLLYLAAAGVGRIGIVDYDVVDVSNLQRQVIHSTLTLGQLKVESARQRMVELNPLVQVDVYNQLFTSANAMQIVQNYDVVVDASDNFPTRYLVNDVCVLAGKPDVYGSIFRFEGQVSVFDGRQGPCYRCLFPEPPPPGLVPTCAEGGVFGVLPGTIGSIQATEVIKLVTGAGTPLVGKLILYDALDVSFQTVKLRKNPHCKICGSEPEVTHLIDYEEFCGLPAHDQGVDRLAPKWEIEPNELAAKLKARQDICLVDVREPVDQQISMLPGARLIPYGEIGTRLDELDRSQEIVLFCRTGTRSGRALQILLGAGFQKVKNLRGGINAWAEQVEPGMYRY
jgi:sulfur-carrier protein adenylyltransferase/sulfurtransferase